MALQERRDPVRAAAAVIKRLQDMGIQEESGEEWHVHRMISSLRYFEEGVDLGTRLLVDKWPNFSCVVLLRPYDEDADEVELFCRNEKTEIDSCMTSFLNWFRSHGKPALFILCLPHYTASQLQAACAEDIESVTMYNCITYILRPPYEAPQDDLPEDFCIRPLTRHDVPKVMNNWKYADPNNSPRWMNEIFRKPHRSLAVCENGVLVGHGFTHRYGTLGGVFVEPRLRRKGIGKFIVRKLASTLLENENFVVADVDVENDVSKTLFESVGFIRKSSTSFWLLNKKQDRLFDKDFHFLWSFFDE